MDTVDICVISFLLSLVTFFLVICRFKYMTRKSKGTGDNPGGHSIGGGGADQGVTITALGVSGMSAGCAGNGGDGRSGCGADGGGVADQGVTITVEDVSSMLAGCAGNGGYGCGGCRGDGGGDGGGSSKGTCGGGCVC